MFYLKVFASVLWFAISGLIGVSFSLTRWKHPDNNFIFSYLFTRGICKITGVKIGVKNGYRLLSTQPCIYMGNHQDNLDVFVQGYCNPRRTICLGKKEVLWIPFFGWVFYLNGNIPIDRSNHEKALKSMEKAKNIILRKKLSLYVFPEGHRNNGAPQLLPFKKGTFHLAISSGLPIVPVVAEPITFFIDLKKRIIRKGTLQIEVLDPIPTRDKTLAQIDELIDLTRSRMQEAFDRLRTRTTSPT